MEVRSYLRAVSEVVAAAQAEIDGGAELTPGLLAEAHLMLPYYTARSIARKMGNRAVSEDLVSIGVLALYDAAKRYDPSRGAFKPYARAAIEMEMRSALAMERGRGTVSTPHAVREARRLSEELERRREADEPTDLASLAKALGIRAETVTALLRLTRSCVSLDAPISYDEDEEETPIAHLISDERAGPEEVALQRIEAEERKELQKAVSQLPETVRAALGLTTGYRTFDRMSLGDLVAASNHSRQQRARDRLRRVFKEGGASAYRLGFDPDDATGPGTGKRLPSPAPTARKGAEIIAADDSPTDIWQRLTDRWRQAAEMDTGQCVGS